MLKNTKKMTSNSCSVRPEKFHPYTILHKRYAEKYVADNIENGENEWREWKLWRCPFISIFILSWFLNRQNLLIYRLFLVWGGSLWWSSCHSKWTNSAKDTMSIMFSCSMDKLQQNFKSKLNIWLNRIYYLDDSDAVVSSSEL